MESWYSQEWRYGNCVLTFGGNIGMPLEIPKGLLLAGSTLLPLTGRVTYVPMMAVLMVSSMEVPNKSLVRIHFILKTIDGGMMESQLLLQLVYVGTGF